MKPVISPIDRKLIQQELIKERFLRKTNNGHNELYIITHHNSPNTMQEIGRLREISFRLAGGGTGKSIDIDYFDTCESPYNQLIVWDPNQKEILGGYRYMFCDDMNPSKNGRVEIATSRLFHFSDRFYKEYMPYIIELGRSFVQPAYQSANRNKKSIYALDNLWDGLGAIYIKNKKYKYFFGKVTMYPSYNAEARNLILYFLRKHFKGPEDLIYPYDPLPVVINEEFMKTILTADNYQDDLKILSQAVRARGEVIPPLINAYINLSPTLKSFGTAINRHFGDVEETAILLTISDMDSKKIERHIHF